MDDMRKVLVIVAFLSSLLGICSGYGYPADDIDSSPVVVTSTGAIRGKKIMVKGNEVTVFFGIPYAEPPVGKQRFKKTAPKLSWFGTYDATTKPPPCMQYSRKDLPWISKMTPSEDCLYLNIWVPGGMNFYEMEPIRKPVLLWIYGGGYFSGSSEIDLYDGATLAGLSNVIVVSVNYRVGSFGFMTSGTEEAPGNMGLHDQYVAIEWVRNNIGQFNGDPNKITLFGQSAGAASIGFHLISPLSRNVFKRAIMQSGGPYHPLLALHPSVMINVSNALATAVGCADDMTNMFINQNEVLECLRKIDPMQLATAESLMLEKVPFRFLPIYGDDFMPENPIAAMTKGNFKPTQLLIGTTPDEGSVLLHYILPDLFPSQETPKLNLEQAKAVITELFQNSVNPPPEVVSDFYLKDISDTDLSSIVKAVYDSYGDYVINCPAVFFAEKFSEACETFYYYFTHRPSNSPWGKWAGVVHFEEIPFVFGVPIRNSSSYTPEDRLFSQSMMQRWVTFARYGVPVVSKTEGWPKFTQEYPVYMELNPKSLKTGEAPHRKGCDFWRNYFVPT